MRIPRLHLFELEDQPWFPTRIRNFSTDYLVFLEHACALHRPVVPLLAAALRTTKTERVIDLCSGAGGPILPLQKALATEGVKVHFTLTDRFPNVPAFERATAPAHDITFASESVDARAVPASLKGFRTMFNAFHHFRPVDALSVLRDAMRANESIGIFELPNRSLQTLVPMLLLTPLLVMLATPFMRPFRWERLLWTYLLPLVPLTSWWDGIVSQLRAYTPAELQQMADALGAENYSWRAGQVSMGSVAGQLTYLLGHPAARKTL